MNVNPNSHLLSNNPCWKGGCRMDPSANPLPAHPLMLPETLTYWDIPVCCRQLPINRIFIMRQSYFFSVILSVLGYQPYQQSI